MKKTPDNRWVRDHYLNDYQPPDCVELEDFLNRAERDASARAGDLFEQTPFTAIFADAELTLIAKLRDLMTEDAQTRIFIRGWRRLVETTNAHEYPQRRGGRLPSNDGLQWTVGVQLLRASVTLFDAFVQNDFATSYRVLGTVDED
jgi:hypothetical protein